MGVEKYRPKLSDFRLEGDQIIPEIESSNALVFSGSISAVPAESGVDRFTSPPITVVMQQKIGVRDATTGAALLTESLQTDFEEPPKKGVYGNPDRGRRIPQGGPSQFGRRL